jgi:glycosyltransferase involved in cell wall biosynthesis
MWNWRAETALERLLRRTGGGLGVVHVHSWTKVLSSSIFRAAARVGWPVVVTAHDYFLKCPNGGFFVYPRAELCLRAPLSWECILTHCDSRSRVHKLWRIARQICLEYVLRKGWVQGVIFPSARAAEVMSGYLEEVKKKWVLENPIAPPRKRARVKAEANELLIGVGRVAPEKGWDLLGRAAEKVGAQVAVIGDGPWRATLAKRFPLLEFVGWLGEEELEKWWSRARALVCTSLCWETYGLVVREAQQRGVPAIVPKGTALAELVEDGVTGLAFERGNTEALAECLTRVLQDERLVADMSRAAYERSEKQTVAVYVERLEEVYRDLLEGCAGG